ncbi:hypothetical protein MTO96_038074 [Rhipicephalus appendiculatus]
MASSSVTSSVTSSVAALPSSVRPGASAAPPTAPALGAAVAVVPCGRRRDVIRSPMLLDSLRTGLNKVPTSPDSQSCTSTVPYFS